MKKFLNVVSNILMIGVCAGEFVISWIAHKDFFVKIFGEFPSGGANWFYNIIYGIIVVAIIGIATFMAGAAIDD